MHILSVIRSDRPVGHTHHFHDCHQMIYIVKGRVCASVNEKEYILDDGDLLILSRFDKHSIRVLSPEYIRYNLLISAESSPCLHDNYMLSSVLTNHGEGFRHVNQTAPCSKGFETLLKNMAEEYTGKASLHSDMLDLYFRQFLILLHRCCPEIFLPENSPGSLLVKEIQGRFESDFQERFSLGTLADEYHVSQSYLSHLFKKITGYAPMEYLQACRSSAAKRYLTTTDLSIKEIVSLCGFSDESNFSRTFREKNGITPSEFRIRFGSHQLP